MEERETFAAHVVARVRGMRSALLSWSEIDGFVNDPSVDNMAKTLLSSPYEEEMADALTRYEGADAVEDAVTRNLANTFQKLHRLSQGHLAELVTVFLARWDLAAIKSLLRIKHHDVDGEAAESALLPGPGMPVAVMKELAASDSMESLVQGLIAANRTLCRRLPGALTEYKETGRLNVLEEALDRTYFVDIAKQLDKMEDEDAVFLRQLMRMEIDRVNLRIVSERHSTGAEAEALLARALPGGTIVRPVLHEIANSPDAQRAAEAIQRTAYGDLESGIAYLADTGRFSKLDRQMELAFLGKLRRVANQNVFSIAVLMRFAWLKYNEVVNLRMIARGKDVNLSGDVIRQELIHV